MSSAEWHPPCLRYYVMDDCVDKLLNILIVIVFAIRRCSLFFCLCCIQSAYSVAHSGKVASWGVGDLDQHKFR